MIPQPTRTITNILQELNGSTGIGDWIRAPGYFAVSTPTIEANAQVNFLAPTNGLVLIIFINTKTAEVRSYLAKITDDEIRTRLW